MCVCVCVYMLCLFYILHDALICILNAGVGTEFPSWGYKHFCVIMCCLVLAHVCMSVKRCIRKHACRK